jgi:hypothetical protein
MLCSQQGGRRNLVLFLINAHEGTAPEILQNNYDLAELLLKKYPTLAAGSVSSLLTLSEHLDLVLLRHDSGERLLERKRAVGQARKIASDLACALWSRGYLRRDLCFSTDCDALWPEDFFRYHDLKLDNPKVGFYALSARHDLDSRFPPEQRALGKLYDLHLLSYQKNIQRICPQYGFSPIGGAMAYRYLPYAQVRGFPRLDAAEDFYLANKIAKISKCVQLLGSPISLAPRFSQRVPFGTGVKLQQYATSLLSSEQPCTYSPQCYEALNFIVTSLTSELESLENFRIQTHRKPIFSQSQVSQKLGINEQASLDLLSFLEKEGLDSRMIIICQQHDRQRRNLEFWQWFDGLKILRIMNFCHRHLFAPIPIDEPASP